MNTPKSIPIRNTSDSQLAKIIFVAGSVAKAARQLSITRKTIYSRLQKYGFPEVDIEEVYSRAKDKEREDILDVKAVTKRIEKSNAEHLNQIVEAVTQNIKAMGITVLDNFESFQQLQDYCTIIFLNASELDIIDSAKKYKTKDAKAFIKRMDDL